MRRALRTDGAEWRADVGVICSLSAGVALCDRAEKIARDGVILRNVALPELLVPFIVGIVTQTERPICIEWPGARFAITHEARGSYVGIADPVDVTITPGSDDDLPLLTCALRYAVPPATGATLGAFAQRTYAPETDARRIAGAGAGLSDND